MEEEVRNAVFGNVGTTVAFRVGPFDAEVLETIFTPQFEATDLVNLGFAQIYLTLMIDGVGSPPFSATTLPPFDAPPQSFVERVVASSREQFAKPRNIVETTIEEWTSLEKEETPPPRPKTERRDFAPRQNGNGYERPRQGNQNRDHGRDHRDHKDNRDRPPREERPAGPPLEGAKSLKEALAEATGHTFEPKPQGDLRGILGVVAPSARAQVHTEHRQPEERPPHEHVPGNAPKEPAGLPEQELRSMLAVDEDEPYFEKPDK